MSLVESVVTSAQTCWYQHQSMDNQRKTSTWLTVGLTAGGLLAGGALLLLSTNKNWTWALIPAAIGGVGALGYLTYTYDREKFGRDFQERITKYKGRAGNENVPVEDLPPETVARIADWANGRIQEPAVKSPFEEFQQRDRLLKSIRVKLD